MSRVDRERLRGLVADSGRSARAISLGAGLGATAIKDILNGKSRDPGAATLAAIAAELHIPVTDLMDGDPATLTHVKLAPRFLPVRYKVQAGHWYEVDADEPPEQIALAVLPDPRYSRVPQWLEKVVGDSVDLRIPPGHYAHVVDAIELGYAPRDGDWVVVERQSDQGRKRERTIKQVSIAADGRVLLCPRSKNPRWKDPIQLDAGVANDETAEVRVVGLVIAAIDSDF